MDSYGQFARALIINTIRDLSHSSAQVRGESASWLATDDADLFFYACNLDRDSCLTILRQRGLLRDLTGVAPCIR